MCISGCFDSVFPHSVVAVMKARWAKGLQHWHKKERERKGRTRGAVMAAVKEGGRRARAESRARKLPWQ